MAASAKEIKALSSILSMEENADKTAEEVAELVIAEMDRIRSETRRFVAIFQVVSPSGPGWPFIIGPFSTYLQAMRACEWYGTVYDQLAGKGYQHRRMIGVTMDSMKSAAQLYVDNDFIDARKDKDASMVRGLIRHVR